MRCFNGKWANQHAAQLRQRWHWHNESDELAGGLRKSGAVRRWNEQRLVVRWEQRECERVPNRFENERPTGALRKLERTSAGLHFADTDAVLGDLRGGRNTRHTTTKAEI
jgi:hypothetical protein